MGRLTNTLGWFQREFGDVSRAIEYDHQSMELGRTSGVSHVEISALINLGRDYLALGQYERALSYLKPTLDRVEREVLGTERWRWRVHLPIALAEVHYAIRAYEQALSYVEAGLNAARATSLQKYVAQGRALRGKILIALKHREAGGRELQRAFALGEQLHSPSLFYPLAYELGQWYEIEGQKQEAAKRYGQAKTAIERMAASVDDEGLRAVFLQSALVQAINESLGRTR